MHEQHEQQQAKDTGCCDGVEVGTVQGNPVGSPDKGFSDVLVSVGAIVTTMTKLVLWRCVCMSLGEGI